ncbi:MAG: Toxin RelG [Candidatus Atribacteria bacterium ADurb.Bin276]|uniref:Toxin RelG n=1 Tax=Candidatus Atribacter allofermentans TaxID=1852833 RepID=A0A1V5T4C4_9BACT|nr:MAG: Toxin RelG [Candidatus Atribacteria bacterium ADurb.Bin276]
MWKIEWDDAARKELRHLGHTEQKKILNFLRDRISTLEDPRNSGKPLTGNKMGLWRYRLGDYRIVCKIYDQELLVLVLKVGHRKKVYR